MTIKDLEAMDFKRSIDMKKEEHKFDSGFCTKKICIECPIYMGEVEYVARHAYGLGLKSVWYIRRNSKSYLISVTMDILVKLTKDDKYLRYDTATSVVCAEVEEMNNLLLWDPNGGLVEYVNKMDTICTSSMAVIMTVNDFPNELIDEIAEKIDAGKTQKINKCRTRAA